MAFGGFFYFSYFFKCRDCGALQKKITCKLNLETLEFMYLVSTRMEVKSYRKRLRSLLLSSLTLVFVIVVSVLINSFEY